MSNPLARFALIAIVALLCAIGIAAGTSKTLDVADALRAATRDPQRLSERDQVVIDQLASIMRVEVGSPKYQDAIAGGLAFHRTYTTYPIGTLLHVVPGALLLLVAPLQFSARVRRRHLTLHRWSGRVLLAVVVVTALSAFFFGLVTPYAGTTEAVAALVFGGLFLFAAARAYLAIRRRDVTRHREWMIRMFSLALGISTIRIVLPILTSVSSASMRELFGLSLWIGWPVTLAAGEVWIRLSRRRERARLTPRPSIVA